MGTDPCHPPDVTVATMHAHLDHDNCIETVIVRDPTTSVVEFANAVMAQTGVRHGKFYPIPVEVEAGNPKAHTHVHARPKS
jgi:CopG family transcriptional regulator, nickel-responsive regulator